MRETEKTEESRVNRVRERDEACSTKGVMKKER